jgi:hypothetical protein
MERRLKYPNAVQLVVRSGQVPLTSYNIFNAFSCLYVCEVLSESTTITIYRNLIFPVLLYGRETWFLTLREEHRLRVFENRALRGIFWPKRGEVTWGWRKIHNEEFHTLYSSPDIITMIKPRRMRWEGHVAQMGRRGLHIGYWWKARRKETTEKKKV